MTFFFIALCRHLYQSNLTVIRHPVPRRTSERMEYGAVTYDYVVNDDNIAVLVASIIGPPN
jgi:hypothetical protein